jgi:hypothetical protein
MSIQPERVGIDELLALTGTDREAKAFAFLYATFKRTEVSANPVQDALDCLVPFIAPYLNSNSGKQVSNEGIKQYLATTYGFDIPLYAIDQLLEALKRSGYVEYRKIVGRYFAKAQGTQFETTKQEIEIQFDVVIEELVRYAKRNGFELEPPSGTWADALINFLKSRGDRNEGSIENVKGIYTKVGKIESSIVGGFIRELSESNPELFRNLLNVFMGVLIEDFISSISEIGNISRDKPVRVLYDTSVLLQLLGCSGRLPRVATQELNRYLQDLGFSTYYFSGNEEEVANIIATIISKKDSGKELEGETGQAISNGEVIFADIRALENAFSDRLAQIYNVFPADDLEKSVIDNAAYQIDERGFAEYIKKEAISKGGFVFVTTNRFLAQTARKFLMEQKVIRGPQCPPMLTVGQIATIAWLMKEHVLAPEKAGRELLSNCFAAIRPDQDWFRYFRESLEKITGPVDEYAKMPKNALILQAARRIAQDESGGNSAIVRELNMVEILNRAEDEKSRAWNAREAEIAAEREATAAENARIVQELEAKQEKERENGILSGIDAAVAAAVEAEKRAEKRLRGERRAKSSARATRWINNGKLLIFVLFLAALGNATYKELFGEGSKLFWGITVFLAAINVVDVMDLFKFRFAEILVDKLRIVITDWLER